MLLTELILSKRGPLAKVWLSAHQERKLSKQQTLGVDVGESVEAILEQDEGPIALRLSGQLMLGVTRIYSRKVQYLLDDCKETRERITLAFRPGVVDLPEDQIRASKNSITFADAPNDFNFMDWSWAAAPPEIASRGFNAAPETQLNLRPKTREFGAYNFGRPMVPSIYGRSSTSRHGSHDETSSHLDSQDFSGVDLGLTGDFSMEAGREVRTALSREGSLGMSKRGSSLGLGGMGGDYDSGGMDMGFDGVDLGLDLADQPDLPALEERSRRETLSTPPPVSPAQLVAEVSPRTAARMQRAEAAPKVKRPRLLQADEELELADEAFAAPNEDSSILTESHFLPSDSELARLRAIAADPSAHFLPVIKVGGNNMIYAGPADLAPELAELFAFPTNVLRRHREQDEAGPLAKRPRIEGTEAEEGRRGSMFPPSEQGFDMGPADQTYDTVMPGDDYGGDYGGGDYYGGDDRMVAPATPRKQASIAPSRAESIARAIQFGDDTDHPLAMFDSRRTESQSVNETPTKSVTSSEARGGYSKNTGMAMGLLRKELEAIEEADKVVEFDKLADRASKRAASAFFFEMLVLGTKDCVRIQQDSPFEGIKIRAKPALFEELSA